jgi:hypothetical protein
MITIAFLLALNHCPISNVATFAISHKRQYACAYKFEAPRPVAEPFCMSGLHLLQIALFKMIFEKMIAPYRMDSSCKELGRHSLRGFSMGKLINE